jgi:hypothetical protein
MDAGASFSNDKLLQVPASIRPFAMRIGNGLYAPAASPYFAIECLSSFDLERMVVCVISLLVGASAKTFVIRIMP